MERNRSPVPSRASPAPSASARARASPAPSRPAAHARGAVIRHLGSGKYSDVFKVQPAGSAPGVVMKVSYYRDDTLCQLIKRAKAGDVQGARIARDMDSIRVSSNFARVTAGLVQSVSPHFVVVFCDHDCKSFAPRLGPLLRERLKQLTPAQKRYNNVCFMEVFHTNLTKFLTGSSYDENTLRVLIFQVVYTLAALQKRFPGFRHNDLSTNNVLLKRLRVAPAVEYRIDGQTFRTSAPVLAALSDYDFTHVPGHVGLSNERVMFGKYKVDGRRNDSYDTHFFLKSVLKCIQRRTASLPQTTAFLRRLRLRPQDRQNGTSFPRLRPSALLRDPYFAPLRRAAAGAGPPGATYSA